MSRWDAGAPAGGRALAGSTSSGGGTGRTRAGLARSRRPFAAGLALAALLGVQLLGTAPASAATGPTAVDDVGDVSVSLGGRIPYAANDVAGSAALRLDLSGFPSDQLSALPAGSQISADGSRLTIPGSLGLVMRSDGTIQVQTVTTGRWRAQYRIVDANGATARAYVTVVVSAGGVGDEIDTVQGRAVTADVLSNDKPGRNADGTLGSIDRTSVRFPSPQSGRGTVSSDGLTVTQGGVGVFTANPATGLVTFTPDFAYVGNGGGVEYTARDTTRAADGSIEHHTYKAGIQWGVREVVRFAISESVSPNHFSHVGDVLTWKAKIANVGPSVLDDLRLSESTTRLSARTCSPVPLGGSLARGQSTVCTATSVAEQRDFDAVPGGQSDSVTATATTVQDGNTLTVSSTAGTYAAADLAIGLGLSVSSTPASVSTVGQRVDYTVVARNRGNVSLVGLVVRSSSPGVSALVCSPVPLGGALGDSRTTTCRASRTVTAADLTTPALTATFKASAAPNLDRHVSALNATTTSSVPVPNPSGTVTPPAPAGTPVARPDTASTAVGQPVVVSVLANDSAAASSVPLVGSSVRLRTTPDLPAGSVLYGDAKTLKVAGRGVFLVSGTGQITFVPLGGATGAVPTVGYQVADAAGQTARSTLQVTVA